MKEKKPKHIQGTTRKLLDPKRQRNKILKIAERICSLMKDGEKAKLILIGKREDCFTAVENIVTTIIKNLELDKSFKIEVFLPQDDRKNVFLFCLLLKQ